jgi:hypothetical protein
MASIVTGRAITVTVAGTRERVVTTAEKGVAIVFRARNTNTGAVNVGGSDVTMAIGFRLEPGNHIEVSRDREFIISDIYVDAATSGDICDIGWERKDDAAI